MVANTCGPPPDDGCASRAEVDLTGSTVTAMYTCKTGYGVAGGTTTSYSLTCDGSSADWSINAAGVCQGKNQSFVLEILSNGTSMNSFLNQEVVLITRLFQLIRCCKVLSFVVLKFTPTFCCIWG